MLHTTAAVYAGKSPELSAQVELELRTTFCPPHAASCLSLSQVSS